MKKKKMGAPPKPPEERKGRVVQVRLTDAELDACEAAAEVSGQKMSAWGRDVLVRAARRGVK